MSGLELRYATTAPEVRDGHIHGSIPFDRPSRKLSPGFVETIDNRAFDASLAGGEPILCYYMHDPMQILGSSRSGTLKLAKTARSLDYDCDPPKSQAAAVEAIQRGDVQGSSFGFTVEDDDWSQGVGGLPQRRLLAVNLLEVSPVAQPAYPDATSQVRALDGAVDSLAKRFDADPSEIRALMNTGKLPKLFRLTTRPSLADEVAARYRRLEVLRRDPYGEG